MANRQLSADELKHLAAPLLESVRKRLLELSGGDSDLHFALRRKLAKELGYDERGKPMARKALKLAKRLQQNGLCALCRGPLPERGAVLDRLVAMLLYTPENTQLLCPACDSKVQQERNYA